MCFLFDIMSSSFNQEVRKITECINELLQHIYSRETTFVQRCFLFFLSSCSSWLVVLALSCLCSSTSRWIWFWSSFTSSPRQWSSGLINKSFTDWNLVFKWLISNMCELPMRKKKVWKSWFWSFNVSRPLCRSRLPLTARLIKTLLSSVFPSALCLSGRTESVCLIIWSHDRSITSSQSVWLRREQLRR